MKRFIGIILPLLGAIMLGVLIASALYLRRVRPDWAGAVELDGLQRPVEVWRDSLAVPHVWAENAEDLFFAQGFLHAQDRLWQMELFRRVAQGRLSEVLGKDLVAADRFLRTIGLWRAAAAQEATLTPESRRLLEAYAAGVNARLRQRSHALPPELLLLRIEPEPWTVRHTLAIEKIMAWDLALYERAAQLTRVASQLDSSRLRLFHEAFPDWGPMILETAAPRTGPAMRPPAASPTVAVVPSIPHLAAVLLDAASMTRASNAWVVDGTRTASGKPILANDMHLALRAPSIWYLMALHGGDFDVAGVTLPGAPFVVTGHNRASAWGFTNAMVDDVDFFLERPDPRDSTRYQTPWGSEPFVAVQETLQVKGESAPEVFTVRSTRHGPVLPDVGDRGGEVVAMQWAGHEPSGTLEAISALNRASTWDEFVAAVRRFDNPHQNVVYADTSGDFGYVMGGRVPVRGEGKLPPILPVPGWTGEWDWRGYWPPEEHPAVKNPPQGYVVTANNRQADGERGALISSDWEPPFRAARIRQLIIESGKPLDAETVHRMQLDVKDLRAQRYRAGAVAAAADAGVPGAVSALESWDLYARADSRGAALFYAWYEELRRNVQRSLFGSRAAVLPTRVFDIVLDSASLTWLGPGGRAAFDSLARAAARTASSAAAGKVWGELHSVAAEHALSSADWLERLLDLDVGPVPAGGSRTTVNVSDYPGSGFPVRSTYAPSHRHVADLGNLDGSGGFILPTGQSGLSFDRHYRDQWRSWLGGGLWRIPLDRTLAGQAAVHRLTLSPVEPEGYEGSTADRL